MGQWAVIQTVNASFDAGGQTGSVKAARGCVGWLSVFNGELSQKGYWRGPRSQEVRERERL